MKIIFRAALYLLSFASIIMGISGLLAHKFEANPPPVMYPFGAILIAMGFGFFYLAGKMK